MACLKYYLLELKNWSTNYKDINQIIYYSQPIALYRISGYPETWCPVDCKYNDI